MAGGHRPVGQHDVDLRIREERLDRRPRPCQRPVAHAAGGGGKDHREPRGGQRRNLLLECDPHLVVAFPRSVEYHADAARIATQLRLRRARGCRQQCDCQQTAGDPVRVASKHRVSLSPAHRCCPDEEAAVSRPGGGQPHAVLPARIHLKALLLIGRTGTGGRHLLATACQFPPQRRPRHGDTDSPSRRLSPTASVNPVPRLAVAGRRSRLWPGAPFPPQVRLAKRLQG